MSNIQPFLLICLFTAALVSMITPNVWTHAQFVDELGNNDTNATSKLQQLQQKFEELLDSNELEELDSNDTFTSLSSKFQQKVQELGERRLDSTESESDNSGVAEIVLLSQKLKKSSSYHNLVGQVKNIGNDTAQYVRIDATIYDKNGDVIGTDFGFATSKTLKPNQKSSFDLLSDDFKGMDHYEISLQWRNPDFSEGYTENAQIYETNKTNTGSSDSN